MKKQFGMTAVSALMGILTAVTLMTGCGQKPAAEPAPVEEPVSAEETVSEERAEDTENSDSSVISGDIVIWTHTADQIRESIVPAFNEIYPDINVEVVNLSSSELKTKLLAALAAGTGAADVCQLNGDDTVQFIENGGLSDLTPYAEEVKDDFPAFQMANNTDADDKIYAVPIDAGPCGLYYRQDLLESAGITEAPKTWDEFFAAGEKLKEKGIYLHRMPKTGDMELLRMLVQQQGGSFFDAEGNPTLDTPEFRNAVELEIKMYESGYTLDVDNWTPAYDAEMQGDTLATHMGAAWYVNTFLNQWPEAANTWKIAPMPQFEGSEPASCNNGGSNMVIPEQCENKEAAWAFISFYCASNEGRLIATENMGELPSYLPVFETTEMQEKTVEFFGDQKVYAFFKDELEKVPTEFRITAAFPEVCDAIDSSLGKAITRSITVDELVAELQAAAEGIVAKY